MERAPNERAPDGTDTRTRRPWWYWLFGLIPLLLLLWFVLSRDRSDTVVLEDTTETSNNTPSTGAGIDAGVPEMLDGTADSTAGTTDSTAMAGGAITNVEDLYGESLASLVGRQVEIEDATVLSVTGDSTFYVGTEGRRFLVALSNLGEADSGPGTDGDDGRFNIDVGDRVSVRGTVTPFDASNGVFGRLTEADRTEATTRGAYVNVTRAADVASR